MTERLVDVLDSRGTVLHTYSIACASGGEAADDAHHEAKALEAAALGGLVRPVELSGLTAELHVSRGGQMAPYGDHTSADSQFRTHLEQAVRESAYAAWEVDGCPSGRDKTYWYRALDKHLRERAYALWQQEGSPQGTADEDWRRVEAFEA